MCYKSVDDSEHKLRKNDVVASVINYIDNNWTDAELNLNKLSDIFGYVPSYISVLFRERTNVSVIKYINKKRIDKVKELLKNKNLTLSEICSKTGFHSEASLIRVFKNYEKITPGKYRELN